MRKLLLLVPVALAAWACSCDETGLSSAEGELVLSPGSLDFGTVFLREERARTVQVDNTGRTAVTLAASAPPAGFAVEPTAVNVPAGGSATLTVTFAPLELGPAEGTVDLGDGIAVPVRGIGVERAIQVDEVLDFGDVRVGQTVTLPLPVESLSGGEMEVVAAATGMFAPNFRLAPDRLALGPRGAGTFQVSFTPAVRGLHSAQVTFELCEGCADVSLRLRGNGVVDLFQVRPDQVEFGTVSPGNRATERVRLTNVGDMSSSVVFVELADGAGPGFSVEVPALPVEVPPGEVLDLDVVFAPGRIGDETATLQVQAGATFLVVPIRGRGGSADLVAVPDVLDFGVQTAGTPAMRTVLVQNVGEPSAVQVTDVRVEGDDRVFTPRSSAPLPADVGTRPLAIDVTFDAGPVDLYGGTLVIVTDDPDEPALRVPLAGRIVSGSPCTLIVRPQAVRFGFVHAGEAFTEQVRIRNDGFDDCYVWDFALAEGSSDRYTLVDAPADVAAIRAGDELRVTIQYAPPEPSVDLDEATFAFMNVSATTPQVTIPVAGFASVADLVVAPDPVDFGQVPVRSGNLRTLTLLNRGANAVRLQDVRFSDLASPDLAIESLATLPVTIPAGSQQTIHLGYEPAQVGGDRGELELWLRDALAPLLVDVLGEGTNTPCGSRCEAPVASCPAPQTVWVNSTANLEGAGVDPNGDRLSCAWAIVSAPAGSQAQLEDATACATRFRPDRAGDYVFELTVTDPDGNLATCQAQLAAAIFDGLWIETTWSADDDVDLHLFHPLAGDFLDPNAWFSLPYDCYYSNMSPYWDDLGRADDPSLDRDDQSGTGPENVRVDTPSQSHAYEIGVHWFRGSHGNRSLDVTTSVYCGGALAATVTNTLDYQYHAADVGTVRYTGPNTCTFTPGRWQLTVVP